MTPPAQQRSAPAPPMRALAAARARRRILRPRVLRPPEPGPAPERARAARERVALAQPEQVGPARAAPAEARADRAAARPNAILARRHVASVPQPSLVQSDVPHDRAGE